MKKRTLIRFALTAVATGALASALAPAAMADSYPSRPIKFVVGFPPGGSTDLVTRIVAAQMAEELKQPVIVENKPGAGGNIASQFVAGSPPDGYTIYLGTLATHGINPVLQKKLPFNHIKDFTMISQIGYYTNLVLVSPGIPVKTLGEWIAYAKETRRPMNFGSPGTGTSPHLTGEYFKILTGVNLSHVPYKGSGPALTDLVGGQIDVMFDNLPSALGLVKGGKLRPLAITSRERISQLPDVPTAIEAGLPDMVVDAWVGMMAPQNLPKPIVQTLHNALTKSLDNPQIRAKLEERGVTIKTSQPDEFLAYVKSENEKWAKVVKISGAEAN
ncbi:tripartite tricarboxylate transporter substrate binding protein [Comamonas sp. Sa2CVA6]|uniref:Tripartite tricarboxylate transporter substrate binding protein n=2 Tax=Comamonas avium TaxID=2762231 RepID=A0ABR8SBL5_9BURK|nr:tripartite tricarboxylate transporter substrate binding protein [Comamonas avium]